MSRRRVGGRPPLPKAERRDRLIVFRMRAAEESQLRDAATAGGLTLTEWLRRVTLRAAKRPSGGDAPAKSGQGEPSA